MLSRKQAWRKTRVRSQRPSGRVRPPISLFADGGELEVHAPASTIVKSFSESCATKLATPPATPLRRVVSDLVVNTTRRSIFASQREPEQAVGAPEVKKKKEVCFLPHVRVLLIPTAKELPDSTKKYLWWSKADLESFSYNFQTAIVPLLPDDPEAKHNVLSLGSVVEALDEWGEEEMAIGEEIECPVDEEEESLSALATWKKMEKRSPVIGPPSAPWTIPGSALACRECSPVNSPILAR